MINEQVRDYVEKSFKAGKTEEEITKDLLSVGWKEEQIKEVFAFLKISQVPVAPAPTPEAFVLEPRDGVKAEETEASPIDQAQVVMPETKAAQLQEIWNKPNSQNTSIKFYNPIELISQAWGIFTKRFWLFVRITLLAVLFLLIVLGIGMVSNSLSGSSTAAAIVLVVLGFVIFFYTIFSMQIALLIAVTEENISARDAYRKSSKFFVAYVLAAVFSSLAIAGGLLLLIIPGIIIMVWLSFYQFVLISEGEKGLSALSKSREYVRGKWWGVFGRLLVLFLASYIIQVITRLITDSFGKDSPAAAIIAAAILLLVCFVFSCMGLIYSFLIYKNLKEIKGQNFSVGTTRNPIFIIFSVLSVFLLFGLSFLLMSSLGESAETAKGARIQADMDQLRTQALVYQIDKGSYDNFTMSGMTVFIIDDIKAQGDSLAINISRDAYCLQADWTEKAAWFQTDKLSWCIDFTGFSGKGKCGSDFRCSPTHPSQK